jgi:hypothetical protein
MQKLEESKSHGEINPFLLLQEGQFAESEAGLSLINSLPELMDIATYLRNNFSIDYRNIYETSKKLRTLASPSRNWPPKSWTTATEILATRSRRILKKPTASRIFWSRSGKM